jgi:hypothetical protein
MSIQPGATEMKVLKYTVFATLTLVMLGSSGVLNQAEAQGSCGQYCVNFCKAKGAMGSGFNNCVSQCTPKCEQQKASKTKPK